MGARRWQKRPERLLKAKFAVLSVTLNLSGFFLASQAYSRPTGGDHAWTWFVQTSVQYLLHVVALGIAGCATVAALSTQVARWVQGGWHVLLFHRNRQEAYFCLLALVAMIAGVFTDVYDGAVTLVVTAFVLLAYAIVDAALKVIQFCMSFENTAPLEFDREEIDKADQTPGYEGWEELAGTAQPYKLWTCPESDSQRLFDLTDRGHSPPVRHDRQNFSVHERKDDPLLVEVALTRVLQARLEGKLVWNDTKVRLRTDFPSILDDLQQPVRVSRTSFFDAIGTNDSVPFRYQGTGGMRELWHRACTRHANGSVCISPLSQSGLANQIGVSTLAINHEGKLFVLVQGHRSFHSPSLLAPSGSGSMDDADYQSCGDRSGFFGLVMHCMTRELAEEIHYRYDLVGKTWLVGWSRNQTLGGKPDIYGITVVRLDSAEVPRDERGLVRGHVVVDVGSTKESFKAALRDLAAKRKKESSVFLLANIQFVLALDDNQLQKILDAALKP